MQRSNVGPNELSSCEQLPSQPLGEAFGLLFGGNGRQQDIQRLLPSKPGHLVEEEAVECARSSWQATDLALSNSCLSARGCRVGLGDFDHPNESLPGAARSAPCDASRHRRGAASFLSLALPRGTPASLSGPCRSAISLQSSRAPPRNPRLYFQWRAYAMLPLLPGSQQRRQSCGDDGHACCKWFHGRTRFGSIFLQDPDRRRY